MKTIWYLPSAELDLASIWEFVAESDADAADRILDRIDTATNILKNYPFAGRARPDIAPDARSKPVGKYLILYRVRGTRVEIVRVRHSAQQPLTRNEFS